MDSELIAFLLTNTGYLLMPMTLLFHGHPSRRKRKRGGTHDHFLEEGMVSYVWLTVVLVLIGSLLHAYSQGWIFA